MDAVSRYGVTGCMYDLSGYAYNACVLCTLWIRTAEERTGKAHLKLFYRFLHVLERVHVFEGLYLTPVAIYEMQEKAALVSRAHELHHFQERRVQEVCLVPVLKKGVKGFTEQLILCYVPAETQTPDGGVPKMFSCGCT